MKWFRFYEETLNDPKVQKLPAELFRVWVNLLCVASQNDGVLPDDMEALGFKMRMSAAKIEASIQALIDSKLIDRDDTLHPHNWNGRQYASDSSATRVKRYRERHGNGHSNVTQTVTDTPSNGKSNALEQNRAEQIQSNAVTRNGDFAEFWKAYPKRVDRRHAEKAYRSALKRATHGEILAGLRGYVFEPDPKFIPLAATWLNGDRWCDEKPPGEAGAGAFKLRPLGVGG